MYLALDIGGTFVKYAYMNEKGDIQQSGKYPTETQDLDEFLARLDKIIPEKLEGIAVSSPGVIDSDEGFIRVVTLLPCLNGVGLKDILEKTKDVELTSDQVAEIKAAQEKLMTGAQALFTKMYEQMQGANGAGPDMSNMGGADMGAQAADDDIIDGDFREV